jgi:ParB/RepB/Spo0J family partition protein
MKIQNFCIQRFQKPFRYCYHYQLEDDILTRSIKEQGILNPIWLINKNGVKIIDGHRRWQAAKIAGLTEIPVQLYSGSDLSSTFISAVHLNLTSGKLTTIEKLKILHLAWKLIDDHTYRKVSQLLGLSSVPNIIGIFSEIMATPHWLQEYFFQTNMSLKILSKVIQYPLNHYQSWLKMASCLRLNGTELVQLLESVNDISQRERIAVSKLWYLLDLEKLLSSNITISQKIQQIKKTVDERRFPILHQINMNILENISSLPKSFRNKFQISWDKTLEQSGILLSFRIKLVSDLKIACEMMSSKEIQTKLERLIKQIDIL